MPIKLSYYNIFSDPINDFEDIGEKPLQFNVECDLKKAIELREKYSCVLSGYHINKKLWNTVIVDGSIPAHQLQEFIDNSYLLVSKGKK